MSYCVNCGVKLASSERKCPLCNTRVINPNIKDGDIESNYPDRLDKISNINFKYVAKLIIIVLLGLGITMLLCDLIFSGSITWSIYVALSIMLISSHVIYLVNKNIYISLIVELFSVELFLFFIAYLTHTTHAFTYLVMPFVFVLWGYILLCTIFIKRKKKSLLRRMSIIFFITAITLFVIESGIDLYKYEKITLNWSIYAMIPLIILSILSLLISFNRKLVDEIKQRVFI